MPTSDSEFQQTLAALGPLKTFEKYIAANDKLIRGDRLDNGREIVAERTAIHTRLVRVWADEQHRRLGYDKPFAVVALGGTGRGEMTPFSDTDFAFLFDDTLEGNSFLLELQNQVLQSTSFEDTYGFCCEALPFSLNDASDLDGKQLNSFLDMSPVHDPSGLCETFRRRICETYDPFEHFLHVREFWIGQWEAASQRSENLDKFDIKNEGLRIFLAGIWTLAGKQFKHSEKIYDALADDRDLEAYHFLLRIRAFVHSRHSGERKPSVLGNHPEDVLSFEDFLSFGDMLGPDADEKARFEFENRVRAELLAARRRTALFASGVIRHELELGRVVSHSRSIVYGLGGLRISSPAEDTDPERSRTAVSLLLASQRYRTPIDLTEVQNTFRNAGDWLVPVPELSSLFYEENGSLADSFEFLAQIDGAEDRLFPGYAKFESSLDERVMTERQSLRGKLQREKIRALEKFLMAGRETLASPTPAHQTLDFKTELDICVETALLDADHIAAIKLALKTKRLPLTDDDRAIRDDETSSLYERYSSGFSNVPLAEYYRKYITDGGFPAQTIEIVDFLVANRRAFKVAVRSGINDSELVDNFVTLCGSENLLRALFVFTCADRIDWATEADHPTRWFNIKELYATARKRFQPSSDPTKPLAAAGYSPDQLEILKDFGQDFFTSRYRRYANQFGSRLLELADDPAFNQPKVSILRDGASIMLGVAARDLRGLAATISAVLWKNGIGLRQAHLFSSTRHGLALNFFHLTRRDDPLPGDLTKRVEQAISGELHVHESDDEQLPVLKGATTHQEWRPNQYCLRFEGDEEIEGLIYSLTYRMHRYLKADIFALSSYTADARSFVTIYHNLPDDLSADEAKQLVSTHF